MKKVLLLIVSVVFCGSIFAQQYEPHWPDAPSNLFDEYETLVAMVNVDDHLISTTDSYTAFEVAAFVREDEIRGRGIMKYYTGDPCPIVEIYVRYDPLNMDPNDPQWGTINEDPLPVYFKLYDHSTETEYDYCISSVDIETETEYGFDYNFNTMPVLSFYHTYTKDIIPYTVENGGWNFISSPVGQVSPSFVDNLMSNSFDLYYFDQKGDDYGLEWINIRDGNTPLEPKQGYLYANSGNGNNLVSLIFKGAPYNEDGVVELEYSEDNEDNTMWGWNLVGNPFAQPASIDMDYYRMKADGSDVIAGSGNVGAMEGVFVKAAATGESVTFSPTPSNAKEQIVLNVAQISSSNIIDRTIVRFNEGSTLPKFMLNPNNTKMYISKDNHDYAVVSSSNSGKLPVYFEPSQDGMYTINGIVENVNSIRYLHLIDKVMGTDTDLLRCRGYRFEAKKAADPVERFVLVFSTNPNPSKEFLSRDDDSQNFSFCNNGNWIIDNEGDAILQVVDVNGQILSSEEINGSVSKRIDAAPGVYMLRLINGKDMKIQKIVVE